MNDDFKDLFSASGAYVDNDGTAPGDNLYGAPDPGFTSSEFRSSPPARQSARVSSAVQQSARHLRSLAWSIALGMALVLMLAACFYSGLLKP